MAPKKKEQQKMSLGTFLQDEKLGSWADEMEDMPVYSRLPSYGGEKRAGYSTTTGSYGASGSYGGSGIAVLPVPDKPPFTVHLGNLSWDATSGDVQDFFAGCDCINVRIIEDKLEMKPKGFGYAEFSTRDGIVKALALSGSQFQGRNIRVSVADPPKDRDRGEVRELGDWSRKGPLPDLPGRGVGDRRPSDRGFGGRGFGDGGADGGERRERRDDYMQDDGKIRDFGNWERRGPLPPLAGQERTLSHREGRPTSNDGSGMRDRRSSPAAAWGEGRPQGSQDGSRPPRREFQERPVPERTPTAAEQDSQWRMKMRPDAPAPTSQAPSRDGSEAPSSPAPAAPATRVKLNLTKRTVAEAGEVTSPASASGDSKASPFGAARPIDTAAKEREIEEKRLAAIREKKEADDKAKRAAKEVGKSEKAADAGTENQDAQTSGADKKIETLQREDAGSDKKEETTDEKTAQNGNTAEEQQVKPKEALKDAKPRPAEGGAWRRPSGGPKPPRNDAPRGPRGDGPPRGPRNEGPRGRANGGEPPAPAAPAAPAAQQGPETAALEEDGWSTVSKPKKNQRGGNHAPRAIAS